MNKPLSSTTPPENKLTFLGLLVTIDFEVTPSDLSVTLVKKSKVSSVLFDFVDLSVTKRSLPLSPNKSDFGFGVTFLIPKISSLSSSKIDFFFEFSSCFFLEISSCLFLFSSCSFLRLIIVRNTCEKCPTVHHLQLFSFPQSQLLVAKNKKNKYPKISDRILLIFSFFPLLLFSFVLRLLSSSLQFP